MTENKQVAVEQIDRDAAWACKPACFKERDKDAWMNGVYDHLREIQAFARHRTRALEASQARTGEDVEILATALFEGVDDRPWSDPRIGLLERDEWRSLAAKGLRALTTPTRIEAAQVDVDANRKVALRNLEKSGLRAPTEASQPQEAVRKPWYCELPDSVHAEVTKQVREIQAIAIRLDDQEIQVVAEAVYNALTDAAALTPPQAAQPQEVVAWLLKRGEYRELAYTRLDNDPDWVPLYATPPQAAESGLLDEALALAKELAEALVKANYAVDASYLQTNAEWHNHHRTADHYANTVLEWRNNAKKLLGRAEAVLAKAGKPGEAGNG